MDTRSVDIFTHYMRCDGRINIYGIQEESAGHTQAKTSQ